MSTYNQTMQVTNQWNTHVTYWLQYQHESSTTPVFQHATDLAIGASSPQIAIETQSGKTDYFTVTFRDPDGKIFGIPYNTHLVSLPNTDGANTVLQLDYNDQQVEAHVSDGRLGSEKAALLGAHTSS